MGYVGNQQAEGFVQRPTKQDLTGATGTSLTLTHAVSKEEDIDLYINNVKQEPTTAYTVADTAVTLTGSVVATDDIYVVYNSLALQTVVPPDGSVTNAKIDTMAASKLTGTIDKDRMPNAIAWHINFGDGVTCTNAGQYYPFTSPTTRIDTDSAYDTTNNYYVVPRTGIYALYGGYLRNNNQHVFRAEFLDDSNNVLETWAPELRSTEGFSGYNLSSPLSHVLLLTSGDKIRWGVLCDTAGGTIFDDNDGGEYNYFGGYFIGGA